MSKKGSVVVAFRLHPENHDEQRALHVLEHLEEKGYSRRYIGMAGLLALAGEDLPALNDVTIYSRFAALLGDLDELITRLSQGQFVAQSGHAVETSDDLPSVDAETVQKLRNLVQRHKGDGS